jgi:glutamate-1-semialdehyde aminotransferase
MFRRLFGARDYGVAYRGHNIPRCLPGKTVWGAWVRLENTGTRSWLLHQPEGKRVDLVVLWDGQVSATHRLPLPEVKPGDRITVHFPLQVPAAAGRHVLKLDLVEQGVTLFEAAGAPPLAIAFEIAADTPTPSAALYEYAARTNPWHYRPTRGVQRSGDGGTYPLFAARGDGCHLWDLEGRRYIDYVMGWGAALLGYNEPRVREAMIAAMDTGPVLPLAHPVELDVTRMLIEDIPCAEMAVFGKHGSDACTVAARLARVFTGRSTILYCGYHGWQDWWAEQAGFARSGVPERPRPLIHRFRFNDLADFTRLFDEHRADLAAVMLEPSGPAEGIGGPFEDTDREVLAAIAAMTRDAGAVLVYDEILTGFRYPGGSVQQATGIVPDLACFGKALGGGMPLSALVGSAKIFEQAMDRTHYGPTYRGEIFSLAAARAALQIYRREPVAEHVWRHGLALQQGADALCAELGVRARMVGPPFRMALMFDEPDAHRLSLKRALYHQELLKAGVITYDGVMLPSYAHDDSVLAAALAAMRHALGTVARADATDDLDSRLEIPPG